jgi:hypothetical protein
VNSDTTGTPAVYSSSDPAGVRSFLDELKKAKGSA